MPVGPLDYLKVVGNSSGKPSHRGTHIGVPACFKENGTQTPHLEGLGHGIFEDEKVTSRFFRKKFRMSFRRLQPFLKKLKMDHPGFFTFLAASSSVEPTGLFPT